MDTFDAIKKRRSIRKYLDIPVEWYKITKILEAGKQAPSSGNLQTWRFIVVTDKKIRRELAEASLQQYWMESAPVHIIVCSEVGIAKQFYGLRGERFYSIQNSAAAIQNILLAAYSLNLSELRQLRTEKREQIKDTIETRDENPDEASIALVTSLKAEIKGLDNHYAAGKVEIAKNLLTGLNISPAEACFIGDTIHDYEVATEVGTRCLLVASGHQSFERLKKTGCPVVNSLEELNVFFE